MDLRAYDAVLLGAAAASPALLDRARDAGARVVTTYGMTETCGGCLYDGVPLTGVTVRVDTSTGLVADPSPGQDACCSADRRWRRATGCGRT